VILPVNIAHSLCFNKRGNEASTAKINESATH
jgi:hypothetical protein